MGEGRRHINKEETIKLEKKKKETYCLGGKTFVCKAKDFREQGHDCDALN